MGCLKSIVKFVIIILAIIGFISIGGREFVKEHVVPFAKNLYDNFNTELKLKNKSAKDLTLNELKDTFVIAGQKSLQNEKKIEGDYEITNVKDLMGCDAEIALDTTTGQKMVTVDTKNKITIDLSNTDKNTLKSDMLKIARKHKNIPVKFDDIEIIEQGKHLINGKEQNYVTISLTDKISSKTIVATISNTNEKNSKIFVTFAPKDKYSIETAQKYWK